MSNPIVREKKQHTPLAIAMFWAAALAGTIIAFIITILTINMFFYSPKAQVSMYLEALKSGEPDKALALLNASIPPQSKSNALLTADVVKTSSTKLENIILHDAVDMPESSSKVSVEVEYAVDGKIFSTIFVLENLGKQAIFFDNWSIVPKQLPIIEASITNRQGATINDAAVNLPEGKNTFAVFYPGVYEGQATSKYLYSPQVETIVSNVKTSRMSFSFSATKELSDAIIEESSVFLEQCTHQKVLAPTGCPFSHLKNTDRVLGSTIQWTIVDPPTFTLETRDDNWVAVVNSSAKITADAIDLYTGEQKKLDNIETFSYDAILRVSNEKLSLIPIGL